MASGILPPWELMMSTYSWVTLLAPCKTIGNPGRRLLTSSRISNLSGGGTKTPSLFLVHCSGLNLYAPWEVPMAIAKLSTPVLLTKSSTCSGFVYDDLPNSTLTSSSTPASVPSSASTVTYGT